MSSKHERHQPQGHEGAGQVPARGGAGRRLGRGAQAPGRRRRRRGRSGSCSSSRSACSSQSQPRPQTAGAAVSQLLETVGGTVSAVPLPGQPGPFFPTEEARQRAIVGAADAGPRGARRRRGGARGAREGRRAPATPRVGRGEGGLRQVPRAADRDDSLRFGALEGLALVAEGKGDLAAAADGVRADGEGGARVRGSRRPRARPRARRRRQGRRGAPGARRVRRAAQGRRPSRPRPRSGSRSSAASR